eukprot:10493655-Lingulodinium_polyedra.AAC.1
MCSRHPRVVVRELRAVLRRFQVGFVARVSGKARAARAAAARGFGFKRVEAGAFILHERATTRGDI